MLTKRCIKFPILKENLNGLTLIRVTIITVCESLTNCFISSVLNACYDILLCPTRVTERVFV